MNVRRHFAGALLLAAAIPVVTAGTAYANDADVIRHGSCTDGSTWKIKASPENNRIEVEAEIDTNIDGQSWTWVLKRNTAVAARGTSTTVAPSGSFEVRRVTANATGSDQFLFRATNPDTGEVCIARVTF